MLLRRAALVVALVLLAAPESAGAQPAGKTYRIGVLGYVHPPVLREPLVAGMREHGWIEGRHFVLEWRFTEGKPERADALARELVNLKVDLIVTFSTPLAVSARRATGTIPVVMALSGYPVETGLAASLARPGGNVTGNSAWAGGELWGKHVELLRQLVPGMTRLAVLWDWVPPAITHEERTVSLGAFQRAASALGVTLRLLEIRTPEDLDRALTTLAGERVDALFATSGPVHAQPPTSTRIVELSLARRLPTMTDLSGRFFRAGILMTYSPSLADLTRRAAFFVDRILRGAKPGDLPIEQAAKLDLIINLKTAKAIGLTIPPALLLRADQVIE